MKTKILLGIIVLFGVIFSDLFISCKPPVIESEIPDQTTKSQDDPEQKDDSQEPPKESSKKIKFTATPTNEGIKFEWSDIPNNTTRIQIRAGTLWIEIDDMSMKSYECKYVDAGKEYSCLFNARTGSPSNGFTKIAESERIVITPESGLGEPRITNSPVITFDNIYTVSFDTPPQVNLPDDLDWEIDFSYRKGNSFSDLFRYRFNESTKVQRINLSDNIYGEWCFDSFYLGFNVGSVSFAKEEHDISSLPGIPATMVFSREIIEQNRFRLIATPTSEGIKFEWANIPKNAKKLTIINKKK